MGVGFRGLGSRFLELIDVGFKASGWVSGLWAGVKTSGCGLFELFGGAEIESRV